MITNRELFCTFIGVITTHKDIPKQIKHTLLYESGKEFGISHDEVAEIVKEMEKTLEFVCIRAMERLGKKDNMFRE